MTNELKPVKQMTTEELKAELAVYMQYKAWSNPRFYTVRTEVEDRATAQWVREDVFGHTFDGK